MKRRNFTYKFLISFDETLNITTLIIIKHITILTIHILQIRKNYIMILTNNLDRNFSFYPNFKITKYTDNILPIRIIWKIRENGFEKEKILKILECRLNAIIEKRSRLYSRDKELNSNRGWRMKTMAIWNEAEWPWDEQKRRYA